MTYLEGHKKSGLKVGNVVKVLRICTEAEQSLCGWREHWVDLMDNFIGKNCKIIKDKYELGYEIEYKNMSFNYPYFVLEKVKTNKRKIK